MADTSSNPVIKLLMQHLQKLEQPNYGTVGDVLGTLGTLANGSQVNDAYGSAASDAENQANTLKQQMDSMPTLASLYGPDSPYAKQLYASMSAKDAASGRNSQYENRLTQLQAALADKASTYASQQANMANMYNQSRTAANNQRINATNGQMQAQGQMLGSLFKVGQSSGALPWLNSKISGGLSGLWGNNTSTPSVPLDQSPYAGQTGNQYTGYTTGSDQNNTGDYVPTATDYTNYQPSNGYVTQPTGMQDPMQSQSSNYDDNSWMYQ